MNLTPNYTIRKKQELDADGNILATLMSRRNLTLNNIRVKDGDTLVIGGLIQENDSNNVTKIPILGDIPGLGFFFRSTNSTKDKQELVILISPHIIKEVRSSVYKPPSSSL